MGYKKIINILVYSLVLFSCDEKPLNKNLQEEIAEMGLTGFFTDGRIPIIVIKLKLGEKITIDADLDKNYYGVLIENGYELSRRYRADNPALIVQNYDHPDEFFSTNHDAFKRFKGGGEKLKIINNSDAEIRFVVYKKNQ